MMIKFILKKLAWLPLSLLLISFLCFALSKSIPYDPVDFMLELEKGDAQVSQLEYEKTYKKLKLHKPSFYCAVVPAQGHIPNEKILTYDESAKVKSIINRGYTFESALKMVQSNQEIDALPSKIRLALPTFKWHGLDNQYHHWVSSALKGDFGVSYLDGRPVFRKITEALKWTLLMILSATIISFVVGIALGLFNTISKRKKLVQFLSGITYFIYAMPLFWLATLSLVFLTTDDYGWITNIFPSPRVIVDYGQGFFAMLMEYGKVLILPILLLSCNSLSYISRQMYSSLANEATKLYTKTATLKGLNKQSVVTKHQYRNALLPMITMLTSSIPASLSGSLIIETIFNIPGMGRLLFDSINLADWNVIYAIVMITALITFLSFILADVLYYLSNPKMNQKASQ